jgi:hypothetical protein
MQWNQFTFGVEIECFVPYGFDVMGALRSASLATSEARGNIHATTPGWKAVPDGSLRWTGRNSEMRGIEIVSPILKGEDGIEQVRKVADIIMAGGGKVNATAGLHVHIGVGGAWGKQVKNLAKMYLKYAMDFDSILPISRRALRNRFAKNNRCAMFATLTGEQIDERFARVSTLRDVSQLMNGTPPTPGYCSQRYYAMNFMSYASHGTIEFRQHSGSVESKKICSWIRLLTGFAATAFSVEDVSVAGEGGLERLLRKTDREGARYYRQRAAHLNRSVTQ